MEYNCRTSKVIINKEGILIPSLFFLSVCVRMNIRVRGGIAMSDVSQETMMFKRNLENKNVAKTIKSAMKTMVSVVFF